MSRCGRLLFLLQPLPTRHHRFHSTLPAHPSPSSYTSSSDLHLRFNPLASSASASSSPAKPSAKSYPTPRTTPGTLSKPDRPTLIDLLISTIVLYLATCAHFLLVLHLLPSISLSFQGLRRVRYLELRTTSKFPFFTFSGVLASRQLSSL